MIFKWVFQFPYHSIALFLKGGCQFLLTFFLKFSIFRYATCPWNLSVGFSVVSQSPFSYCFIQQQGREIPKLTNEKLTAYREQTVILIYMQRPVYTRELNWFNHKTSLCPQWTCWIALGTTAGLSYIHIRTVLNHFICNNLWVSVSQFRSNAFWETWPGCYGRISWTTTAGLYSQWHLKWFWQN